MWKCCKVVRKEKDSHFKMLPELRLFTIGFIAIVSSESSLLNLYLKKKNTGKEKSHHGIVHCEKLYQFNHLKHSKNYFKKKGLDFAFLYTYYIILSGSTTANLRNV